MATIHDSLIIQPMNPFCRFIALSKRLVHHQPVTIWGVTDSGGICTNAITIQSMNPFCRFTASSKRSMQAQPYDIRGITKLSLANSCTSMQVWIAIMDNTTRTKQFVNPHCTSIGGQKYTKDDQLICSPWIHSVDSPHWVNAQCTICQQLLEAITDSGGIYTNVQ